jgi:membrane protein insertase Oxa1/YidC/SpoIIIJ
VDIFQILFYQPTFNLMVFFSNVFGNLGWAIIIIALISKLVTLSMTSNQIKNASKAKQLQYQMNAVKKQYAHNQEKQTQELAKIQAKALPGQLGGCFSIIIFIILFVQIRGVIMDLVTKGYHSYNQVAYTETLKKKEDSIKIPQGFVINEGNNKLELDITASNGNVINKIYNFEYTKDKQKSTDNVKAIENNLSTDQKKAEQEALVKQQESERASDISIYNKTLDSSLVSVPINQFLIFTTESKSVHLITDNNVDLTFYIRPPSNETIDYTKTKVVLNGNDLTKDIATTQGDKLNLTFLGMNLSKVATDFGVFNFEATWPYIIIALISGLTQYFVTKLYSAGTPTASPEEEKNKKDDKNKKKKEEPKEEDFAEVMAQTTKQMNLLFPAMTVLMSLGYLGGASFLPSGVTLFWTAQNAFVIIQQMISQRKTVKQKVLKFVSKYSEKLNLVKVDQNGNREANSKS